MSKELEEWSKEKLGYSFKDISLLALALTHPSVSNDNRQIKNYERLEFLGDAVLSMLITSILLDMYPHETEGDLAKRRSGLVNTATLSQISLSLGCNEYIILSKSEEAGNGRNKPSNLENVLEAIIAAIYIDGGIENAYKFVRSNFTPLLNQMKLPPKDPKSYLQEWMQKNGLGLPEYKIIGRSGPMHIPEFEISLIVKNYPEIITKANSKKEGQILAAKEFIEKYIENKG